MGENMLIIMKLIIVTMISLFLAIIIGLILIPYLKKRKKSQTLSIYLSERHKDKSHTPTMGGLIFIIPPLLIITILLLMHKITFSYNLFIILFTFLSYGPPLFSISS